jgi:adenylate cyclase
MFTDMVGSTASAQNDEAEALKLRDEQAGLVRPLFAVHQGREIKSMGDGFLAEFDSALRAVQCAIDIQQHLHERNSQRNVAPIQLRIGVHLGDVEQREGDIFGDAVNIASRIEPLASPGGVCISGEVHSQVRNKIPNRFDRLEPVALKGVRLPLDVYRVGLPWETTASPSGTPLRNRLAVLPLANISPDSKDEYFADGLTEELISALSKIRELRVIARTSVAQYKSTSKTVSQIGTELDVSSVLEGSVRKAGNRLRVTLQLIDAGTQEHIWAKSYDRDLDDVFAIQSDIAEKTAGALRLELLGAERESIRKKPTSNLAAYNLYLKGIYLFRQVKQEFEGFTESVKVFEQAIKEDSNFSLAYATLANIYIALSGETLPHRVALPRARSLVETALKLDPSSSEAHAARGNLAFQQEHDWALAEREFKTAIALNPSSVDAHFWYSYLLRSLRRSDEQIEELRTVIELDPLWETPKHMLALAYAQAGDLASAIASAEAQRDNQPADPSAHLLLGLIYARAARKNDAQRELESATGPLGNDLRMNRAILRAWLGNPEEARRLVTEKESASRATYVKPGDIPELYAVLGEIEKALDRLEREEQDGESSLWFRHRSLSFDSIRAEPRFRALLKKLNLT